MIASCSTIEVNKSAMAKIKQFDEAANFLMVVADQEKDLKETCQITSSEALNLIQPLHAMIDSELEKGPYQITTDHETSCLVDCHCGIYSDLSSNTILKDGLLKKAENMPKSSLVRCAEKTAKWFCSSKLLETLKADAVLDDTGAPKGR